MNERINELIKQATVEVQLYYGPAGISHTKKFDKEKFAELLIRECAELSVNSRYANTKSEYYEGFNEALVYVGNKIKQHFGVEE